MKFYTVVFLTTLTVVLADTPSAQAAINFDRDIQPILAQKCFVCHGPDQQESGLRLDIRESALSDLDSGEPAIVPGSASTSQLIHRVTTNDDDTRMPPLGEGEALSAVEVEALRAWIDAGAFWQLHWSYRELVRPKPPTTQASSWCRNEIDQFVLAKLERTELEPSPVADRYALIKRLYYDLLGLLPTPESVDSFVKDQSEHSYERLVDELLKSPHFGERWARHWLDKARYADSDGYEKDRPRHNAWRYRDWVIDVVNRDLPFDQFSIQQLAGDLEEGATPLDRLATAFHRQTLTNTEGGTDQEEFRVKAVVDRVNTTATVWLGLTVACAQCHDHKYDQISQREYYQLFAFFNNGDEANTEVPINQFISEEKAEQLKLELAVFQQHLEEHRKRLTAELPQWNRKLVEQLAKSDAALQLQRKILKVISKNEVELSRLDDGSYLATGSSPPKDKYSIAISTKMKNIAGLRLETLADPSLRSGGPGRTEHGNFVLSELRVYAGTTEELTQEHHIPLVRASADYSQPNWPVSAAIDGDNKTGWAIAPQFNQNHQAIIFFEKPVNAEGKEAYHVKVVLDQQYGSQHTIGRFRIELIPDGENSVEPLRAILDIPTEQRNSEQQRALLDYILSIEVSSSPTLSEVNRLKSEIDEALGRGKKMSASVISQRKDFRKTHLLHRGDFLQPRDEVQPVTLTVLPAGKIASDPTDVHRLDLARWLFDEANPLTRRVAANQIWAHLFGKGLVRTLNDFGVRGEPPTHPGLLDWLALEYHRLGWSRKTLIKTIVMSSTYRQSSRLSDAVDPENKLLRRQNRFRLEAEIVRDLYLAAAGLLSKKIGGPSVFPPLPSGIAELSYANNFKWKTSEGEDRYRRGMYTFFKRTSPHPNLLTFDCPDANTTNVERRTSNTPLAALATLNNEVFVEAAQAMSVRVLRSEANDDATRMMLAMRLCITRPATDDEIKDLLALLDESKKWYAQHREDAQKMVGNYPPENVTIEEAAAWVVTTRIVLNQDELITRE